MLHVPYLLSLNTLALLIFFLSIVKIKFTDLQWFVSVQQVYWQYNFPLVWLGSTPVFIIEQATIPYTKGYILLVPPPGVKKYLCPGCGKKELCVGAQAFGLGIVVKGIGPHPPEVYNLRQPKIGVSQRQMVVGSKAPHTWKINRRIAPGESEIVAKEILPRRIPSCVCGIQHDIVGIVHTRQVEGCIGQKLVGTKLVYDSAMLQQKRLRPMWVNLLCCLLHLSTVKYLLLHIIEIAVCKKTLTQPRKAQLLRIYAAVDG